VRKRRRARARSTGMRYRIALILFVVGLSAAAAPTGGVEARAEQSRLTFVSAWWKANADVQGRWWWRDGVGSAWVRAGGFQAGPLIVTSDGDGWRRWYPGTTLSSGYWGLAYDGGPWGVWAVQRPDTFEAGSQIGTSDGQWSAALGADRTWPLTPPKTDTPVWTDRLRSGLTYDDGVWLAGCEGTAFRQPADSGWQVKSHGSFDRDSWFAGLRDDEERQPGQPATWERSAAAGYRAWSLRWSRESAHADVWEARWADDARLLGVTWGADIEPGWSRGIWKLRGGVSASGRWRQARWTLSWSGAPGTSGPIQTVRGAWREAGFEAESTWRMEHAGLGWFGPNSTMSLTVRKLF